MILTGTCYVSLVSLCQQRLIARLLTLLVLWQNVIVRLLSGRSGAALRLWAFPRLRLQNYYKF